MDRVVEYLVGDGPNNRYALICRQCQSHNGMALKEEFEYIGRYFDFRKFYAKIGQKIICSLHFPQLIDVVTAIIGIRHVNKGQRLQNWKPRQL